MRSAARWPHTGWPQTPLGPPLLLSVIKLGSGCEGRLKRVRVRRRDGMRHRIRIRGARDTAGPRRRQDIAIHGRAGRDANRVGVAAAIQEEVLVLHVRETFRVEGHADKVEIGIEAVDLKRYVDVVARAAVAIVVDVLVSVAARIRPLLEADIGRGQRH